MDRRGGCHFLMHYIPDAVLVARHAFAPSFYGPWTLSKVVPYNSSVVFGDGETVQFHKRERPHLVFDGKMGVATHLVTGVVAPGKNEHGYHGVRCAAAWLAAHAAAGPPATCC